MILQFLINIYFATSTSRSFISVLSPQMVNYEKYDIFSVNRFNKVDRLILGGTLNDMTFYPIFEYPNKIFGDNLS